MPTSAIPFTGSNKNTDQKFLNGINYTCKNAVVDELGNLVRRPGQTLFVDLGTAAAVTGLFYSPKHNATIAVSGSQVFYITSDGTATDITGDGIPKLGNLVSFADFGDFAYASNGGRIIRIPLDLTAIITLSDGLSNLWDGVDVSLSDGSTDFWTGVDVSLSDGSSNLWTDSPTTPGEYYYTGTDAPFSPDSVTASTTTLTEGTLGSLANDEWAWGDQDSLGANTLYVKVAVGDPDAQAANYIKAVFGEYYYTGSNAPRKPDSVTASTTTLTEGTLASLSTNEWAWGDKNGLGSSTLYVSTLSGDPDSQAADFIQAVFGEYYYTGNLLPSAPNVVTVGSSSLTKGTVGSLVDGEFGWGDQNSLGENTLYIKTTNSDPDGQASGFVTAIINKTDYIQDADAPTQVSHVAVLNRRLIANNLAYDARFEWSDVGDGTVWSGSFATAEAQNDKLLALYVEDERIVLFGANTIEHWYDTGAGFRPEGQEYVQRGVITKHAPAFCRDRWIWLDEYKQLCMLNGRQAVSLPQQNSRGLTKFLQDLDLTDARGRYVVSSGRFYYLCLLPKADKSFLYDIDKDEWYEISYWDNLNAEDDLYRAFSTTYAFGDSWGQMLIGDSRSGKVFSFDTDAYTDNSETIRTVFTTGYVDRGTSENRKNSKRLSGRIEMDNITTADPSLEMTLKFRNENTNSWSYRKVKLYRLSRNQFRWSTSGLGQYYMRQYEGEITSNAPFTMTPMMEDYEVVR